MSENYAPRADYWYIIKQRRGGNPLAIIGDRVYGVPSGNELDWVKKPTSAMHIKNRDRALALFGSTYSFMDFEIVLIQMRHNPKWGDFYKYSVTRQYTELTFEAKYGPG